MKIQEKLGVTLPHILKKTRSHQTLEDDNNSLSDLCKESFLNFWLPKL